MASMTEAERAAQGLLRQLIVDLEGIRERLEAAAVDLPPIWEDGLLDDAVALRDMLLCVVVDRVRPALADLRSMVADLEEGEPG